MLLFTQRTTLRGTRGRIIGLLFLLAWQTSILFTAKNQKDQKSFDFKQYYVFRKLKGMSQKYMIFKQ